MATSCSRRLTTGLTTSISSVQSHSVNRPQSISLTIRRRNHHINHLHPVGSQVQWHTQVWFKERIPKMAFMVWLTTLNRLTTRDRMRSWNLQVPDSCLLCLAGTESRDHLYFQCFYSKVLWFDFFAHLLPQLPSSYNGFLSWIKRPTTNGRLNVICKLLFHALVYFIWSERNARIHSTDFRSTDRMKKEIQLLLRRKLIALDKSARSNTPSEEHFLYLWFANFQSF